MRSEHGAWSLFEHVCLSLKVQAFGIANTDNLETPRPAVVMGISGTCLISVVRIRAHAAYGSSSFNLYLHTPTAERLVP